MIKLLTKPFVQSPNHQFSLLKYLKTPMQDSGRAFQDNQKVEHREQVLDREIQKNLKRNQIIIQDNYKQNYTSDELQNAPQEVKKVFSLQNALPSEILNFKIKQAQHKFQMNSFDVGSSAVQGKLSNIVACMSERIINQINHVNNNRQDKKSARRLQHLIDKRRKMLNYLRRTDYHRVIAEYHIPDIAPMNHHHKDNMRGIPNRTGTVAKN